MRQGRSAIGCLVSPLEGCSDSTPSGRAKFSEGKRELLMDLGLCNRVPNRPARSHGFDIENPDTQSSLQCNFGVGELRSSPLNPFLVVNAEGVFSLYSDVSLARFARSPPAPCSGPLNVEKSESYKKCRSSNSTTPTTFRSEALGLLSFP